jgi:hypothetical protein
MKAQRPVIRATAAALAFVGLVGGAAQVHAGTAYKFTVSCQMRQLVVQWNTGDIDPGKEYLRVSTGTKQPGCSVGDFNRATDSGLPVETYSGASGVVHGIPLIGSILAGIFGF